MSTPTDTSAFERHMARLRAMESAPPGVEDWGAYEARKAAFHAAVPDAEPRQVEAAMREIIRVTGV